MYVAGPISVGDREENVRRACELGRELIDLGFAPLIPHLDYYLPRREDVSWETWLEVDLPWVDVADAIIRVPGESRGADVETKRGVPVYHTKEALCQAFGIVYSPQS